MQQISPVTGLPVIAILNVNGREIRVSSSRPYDRAFLQDYADWVIRKPRQSAAEFIRSQRTAEAPQISI